LEERQQEEEIRRGNVRKTTPPTVPDKPSVHLAELKDISELHPIFSQFGPNRRKVIFITAIWIRVAKLHDMFGAAWMSVGPRPLKYLLGWLIAGTRGGPTRAKIIGILKEKPQNANQLANQLDMDYRTMRHHIEVLEKNRIITSAGEGYGKTYFLSQVMEENYFLFEEIVNKIWKK
jgi:DNA-binding transcriptional ArsR family regulator